MQRILEAVESRVRCIFLGDLALFALPDCQASSDTMGALVTPSKRSLADLEKKQSKP